jgi:hypothetical protein
VEERYLEADVGDDDVLVDDIPAVLVGRIPGQVFLGDLIGHVAVGTPEDHLPNDLLGPIQHARTGRLCDGFVSGAVSKDTNHGSRVPSRSGRACRRGQLWT